MRDAARWAGLSAQRWREIEQGGSLRTAELGRAAEALAVDLGSLARGEGRSPHNSVARFRSASTMKLTAADLRTLALASELGRIGGSLLDLLDRQMPIHSMRQPTPVSDRVEPWKQGYSLADSARLQCSPATGAISNLETTLRSLGIHVARVHFDAHRLDAASLWEPGAVPMILVNSSSASCERTLPRRAVLAHELCHLLYDSGEHDLTTQLSWDEKDVHGGAVEQRARAFGPAFLARPVDVQSWFRSGKGRNYPAPRSKVRKLAEVWGLSYYGAIWHAKNCRIIQAGTAEQLAAESASLEDQLWASEFESQRPSSKANVKLGGEEVEVAPLGRGLIAELAVNAASGGAISEGRAREILTWGKG